MPSPSNALSAALGIPERARETGARACRQAAALGADIALFPELWQIGTHLQDAPKHYFLVRWHRPDRFTMVEIGDQPLQGCKQDGSAHAERK